MIFVLPASAQPFDSIEVFPSDPQVRVIRAHRDCPCQATYAGVGRANLDEWTFQVALERAYRELERVIGELCSARRTG